MELTVREAATLLGRSPRTVRDQLVRGDLPGRKRGGRWTIAREALPLTEAQRRALQARADQIREVVEEALPSRTAARPGQRRLSVADAQPFGRGAELLASLRDDASAVLGERVTRRVAALVERALLCLAESVHQYDSRIKLAALNEARGALARAVALLLLSGLPVTDDPLAGWLATLEGELLPAVARAARHAERLPRGRR
jgi:excisionase family DNA binding protein